MGGYYGGVPKERLANLTYRDVLLRRAAKDVGYQQAVRHASKADPLYWLNTFGWVFEPRKQVDLPFITWGCQDEALLLANECIEHGRDLVAVKSRDMGYTWTILGLFLWRWQFLPLQSLAICSRVDELVELTGNPDTLFWKLDMLLQRQPGWMMPKGFEWGKHRMRKRLLNPELRCDIKGYATTADIARGGRRLAILADELGAFDYSQGLQAVAAMQGATNTVISVSTPQGATGAFHDLWKRSQEGGYHRRMMGHRLHWTAHPEKKRGLYTTRGGKIEILDKAHVFPDDYPFVVDREDKPRSPAYDGENERKSDQYMAQEWDMDFAGAGSAFFDPALLERLEGDYCSPPARRGRLIYDCESLEPTSWVDDPHGPIMLWCVLINGRPAPGEYGNGCDVAAGTGATPSTQKVMDLNTGESQAEYADARRDPVEFARDAVAMSKWFHGAKLIWEINGVGGIFKKIVVACGYRCLYYKVNETGLIAKPTDMPGWHSSPSSKRELFEEWREALGRECFERSRETLRDAAGYIYSDGGGVVHNGERNADDPSAAGSNHGDRAIASALCCKLVKNHHKHRAVGSVAKVEPRQTAKPGSVAWMIEQEKRDTEDGDLYGGLVL